ncbi:MAG TPA: aspartate aminotransferase family protein [Candidatus Corynebacterium avicola]|uniref:Aspartate aminotransferase family protein n=1 Tax=Candidatus Corynebacterium avicola TaxID=2838527 RepID=A0A9D1UKL2_9CORY|nr:aspartate aminotransferase family protein [Candidatus Corynebacterium avicola]
MTTTHEQVADASFNRRPDPWGDVRDHMVRYGAPSFFPELIDSAEGSYVCTESGRWILDFTSGQMSATLGHSHPKIVRTVQETYPKLDHLFSAMLSRPVVNLSTRLAERAAEVTDIDPGTASLDKVVLLSTGSEVNDAAIRMAKSITGKFEVVSFSRSWHGLTEAAAGATYSSARNIGTPGAPGQIAIPTPYEYRPDFVDADGNLDWRKQLDFGFAMVDAQSVGSLAACIVEPVISGGGVLVPPPGYFEALREKCHERGMLLIFDEAQTSMGRTGTWFGFEHDRVTPDILTLSKTLGAGLPLAALMTTTELEQKAYDNGFIFYTSHVNDPVVAAVGNTVMDVIEQEHILENVEQRADQLMKGLMRLVADHDIVGDARGRGLLQGIEIVESSASKVKSEHLGNLITEKCLELGLHMNIVVLPGMGGVFRIAPPLTVTAEEIDQGLGILDEAVTAVENARDAGEAL